jgi:hypothetical protein
MQGLIASTNIQCVRVGVRLREAGRFASKSTVNAILNIRQITHSLLGRRIVEYIMNRQNDDGGYAFAQGLESNAQDTYYGLVILSLLGSPFPNMKHTVEWLCNFDLSSIYSYYYVGKSLALCNKHVGSRFRDFVSSAMSSGRYFRTVDVYVEVSSEFESTLMILELASILNLKPYGEEVESWLLKHRNKDGGFGAHRYSNINSTYYAVASLNLLKVDRRNLSDTVTFVRKCEQPCGGFTVIPRSAPPYMEHTYYGVMTLDLLGENCRFPSQTADFIRKCQMSNGGFARTDTGISTFENTFHAVKMLKRFGVV